MSKSKFDSSRMLPLFQIIAPNIRSSKNISETTMSTTEDAHYKHKRKIIRRPEVAVHKPADNTHSTNDNIPIHKPHKSKHKYVKIQDQVQLIEDNEKPKVKRKHLIKENDRITMENQNLVEQLTLTNNALTKKESQVLKLKEKVSNIQIINKELANENDIIKTQYQDILVNIEEFKTQVENMKCSKCEELVNNLKMQAKHLDAATSTNKELNEDLNMLKNVVYRLNVQLERYQQKLLKSSNIALNNASPIPTDFEQESNIQIIQNSEFEPGNQHNDHLHTPISWGNVNSHTLGPLLDAYQDTIKEKEEIITKYEFELVNFTDKLKCIIEENEILHKKNLEESEMLKKNSLEVEENRKELKITKEQNDLLIKKCALKHDKLQEICKVYDHKIDTMNRDYDVLQDQYHKTRIELSNLQGKFQSLQDANDSLKSEKQSVIPLTVHAASVNECKRLFEELKTQYENEKSKYQYQIKFLEDQSKDLESKVVEISSEKCELQAKVKNAEKQIKKLEIKLTQCNNTLSHTQISRDACKRQLAKAIEFGRELVTEQESLLQQLSSRHKENKEVKQIGSRMASRMDMLKSQLKAVQQDTIQQLASVEQRIHEQDSSIENMRKEHEAEVETLLKKIYEKDQYIAKLEQSSSLHEPYVAYREMPSRFS